MGTVTIQSYTTKYPITMIGLEAGVCTQANTADSEKNYKRGLDCLQSEHGRTIEFPDVYMILDGYSARTIREYYTHIGCLPSRLQASTRYIDYEQGFEFITPPSIGKDTNTSIIYSNVMQTICEAMQSLEEMGVPREDCAMLLPLGMSTKMVDKRNLRNLIDMSHQRLCARAYHEYRGLMQDIMKALSDYSEEWKYLVENYFKPKCMYRGYCSERKTCGLMPRKDDALCV